MTSKDWPLPPLMRDTASLGMFRKRPGNGIIGQRDAVWRSRWIAEYLETIS
jgi:hypothetical protein